MILARTASNIITAGGICGLAVLVTMLGTCVFSALGKGQELSGLAAAGRYDEARQLEERDLGEFQPAGENLFWQICLESDPERALAAIGKALTRRDISPDLRVRLLREVATIQFARGRYQAALEVLEDLMATAQQDLPGEVYLLAGMAYRALQKIQRSREAFASIGQREPAFPWARYYLGRIALDEGDVVLAQRYFDSASKSPLAERLPSLLAGDWEALRQQGRRDAAAGLQRRLREQFPQSLAMLQINERLERAAAAAEAPAPADSLPKETAVTTPSGRVSLQLAAFSDRGRALAYVARWQAALPDLRMETEPGPTGQLLYKVRTGHFASRAQAKTEAQRLRRVHALEVLVVESDG